MKDFPDDLKTTLDFPKNFTFYDGTHKKIKNPFPKERPYCRIIAYDKETDLYLAKLFNEPFNPLWKGYNLAKWDNVILTPERKIYMGEDEIINYGWPINTHTNDINILIDGVRHYRYGGFGHNLKEIDKAIEILSGLPNNNLTDREKFSHNFILGRCYAEKYINLQAANHFEAAMSIEPDNFYARIAFLAELSVLVDENKFVSCLKDTCALFPGDELLHIINEFDYDDIGWSGFRWKEDG